MSGFLKTVSKNWKAILFFSTRLSSFYCCLFPILSLLHGLKAAFRRCEVKSEIWVIWRNLLTPFSAAFVAWAARLWIRKTRALISALTAFRQTHVLVLKSDISRKTRLPLERFECSLATTILMSPIGVFYHGYIPWFYSAMDFDNFLSNV